MDKKFKLAHFCHYSSPWTGKMFKMWEHQDTIFDLINKEVPIQLHTMFSPDSGKELQKYLDGDKSVVVEGFRDIEMIFGSSEINDCDALFLELGDTFRKEHSSQNLTEEQLKELEYFKSVLRNYLDNCKPIVIYDGDASIFREGDRSKKFAKEIYNEFELGKYDNVHVFGPYLAGLNKINNFYFVPYNSNFDNFNDIKDRSNNNVLSVYIGNNLRRLNFIEFFNKISKFGKMKVYGKNWDPKRFDDTVDLNGSVKLSRTNLGDYYDNCLFGLYGSSPEGVDVLQHFTLRIIEYLSQGIYVIPLSYDYLLCRFPENQIKMEDLLDNPDETIKYLRDNYVSLVSEQRKKLKETFNSKNYVNLYMDILGIKSNLKEEVNYG